MIPPAIVLFLKRVNHATVAHGTIKCLAFAIFFPAGSFVIRFGHFGAAVYVHATIQMFAYIVALTGMGLGIYTYVANAPKETRKTITGQVFTPRSSRLLDNRLRLNHHVQIHRCHPIIRLILITALFFQPILRALYYAVYVREQWSSIWSTLHVWWVRVVLTLAIIEGGFGLRYANNTTGGKIAYGPLAGLIWVSWLGVAVRHDRKKNKAQGVGDKRSDLEEMASPRKGEAG